jgi:FkbM family methyltransferase
VSEVYLFSNGIRLRRSDITDMQIGRYSALGNPNLHEPVEEEWILRSFERDRSPGAIFLDVGAGVGYYSFLIKKRWPDVRVLVVEALPRHAEALDANRALNGFGVEDIQVTRTAVGATAGQSSFVDRGYGSMLAQGAQGQIVLTVETQTLAELLTRLPPVHLMKMDIQGAELEVLTAARDLLATGPVRHVVIGTHSRSIHRGVVRLLRRSGFSVALDDPAPAMQPDGLVVATYGAAPAAPRSWLGRLLGERSMSSRG